MPSGPSSLNPTPSVALLGADAVLAALPATPVQLAHACRRLGYAIVFPASWGDEIVARRCLDRLADHVEQPAILCSCPLVRERILRAGDELVPWTISLVPPPVAAARYLRQVYGERGVHITYVGACPGAADPAIDAQFLAEEMMARFSARGIVLAEQPELFDSVLPPDRRRFYSLPGGSPTAEQVAAVDPARTLSGPEGEDYLIDLAQQLLSRAQTLIDIAPEVGCACSGAIAGSAAHGARLALAVLEPPRASRPVLDPHIEVDADAPVGDGREAGSPSDGGSGAAGPAAGSGGAGVSRRALLTRSGREGESAPAVPAGSPAAAAGAAAAASAVSATPAAATGSAGSAGSAAPMGAPSGRATSPPVRRTRDGRTVPRAFRRRATRSGQWWEPTVGPAVNPPQRLGARPSSGGSVSAPSRGVYVEREQEITRVVERGGPVSPDQPSSRAPGDVVRRGSAGRALRPAPLPNAPARPVPPPPASQHTRTGIGPSLLLGAIVLAVLFSSRTPARTAGQSYPGERMTADGRDGAGGVSALSTPLSLRPVSRGTISG